MDVPRKDSKIGDNMLDPDLSEGQVHKPMNRAQILTGQYAHGDLAEAQMEGAFAFSGGSSGHSASSSSKNDQPAPKSLSRLPFRGIRVVRFHRNVIEPDLVWRDPIDVKAEKHQGDAKLDHIPDFRKDWGDAGKWELYRRAYRVYVGPGDIRERILHGWYVVFYTYDTSYAKNTHKAIEGNGRHIHEDFFITKIGLNRDANACIDVPEEFLSATTEDGWKVYQIYLEETHFSMIRPLIG